MSEIFEKYNALMKEHEATLEEVKKLTDKCGRLATENAQLMKRLQHLLESDFISRFDNYDPVTKTYVLDIRDADRVVNTLDEMKLMANSQSSELGMLKECIVRMTMERLGVS